MTSGCSPAGPATSGRTSCVPSATRTCRVVVLDDLSTGIRENVPADVPFVQATVGDSRGRPRRAAASTASRGCCTSRPRRRSASRSTQPLLYWDENVGGMRSLLQSCLDEGVDRLLFSSSAAVYGEPPVELVTEETAAVPISPYGETKLVGEWMLRDLAAAELVAVGRAALLQRRRRRRPRARRPQRQQPGADGVPGAHRRPQPAAVRRRLPDPRRLVHPRLHPRRRPRRGARRGCPPARRGPTGRGLQRRPRRGHHRQGGAARRCAR